MYIGNKIVHAKNIAAVLGKREINGKKKKKKQREKTISCGDKKIRGKE